MNTVLTVLAVIALAVSSFYLIRSVRASVQVSSERTAYIVILLAVSLLLGVLLILSAFVPGIVKQHLDYGASRLEEYMDSNESGLYDRPLSPEEVRQFIMNSRELESAVTDNAVGGFLMKKLSLARFAGLYFDFLENIDAEIKSFETEGKVLSYRNITVTVLSRVNSWVENLTMVIQLVLIIAAIIFFSAVAIVLRFSDRERVMSVGASSEGIRFGDGV